MTFRERCDALEECYEFMLAYAGQGLPAASGSSPADQVRYHLARAAAALNGLPEAIRAEGLESPFIDVVARDGRNSLEAIELVRAAPAIGSQLIDNLNASIHLRALLTDLFLVDEVLKTRAGSASAR
jgi:hypothetical protein